MNQETCPTCGSGAYDSGVCSHCGSRPATRNPTGGKRCRRGCKRHKWGIPKRLNVNGELRDYSTCLNCPERRVVEVERA
jgi:hypothetical protein